MNDILPPQLQMFLELIRPVRNSINARYTHRSELPNEVTADFRAYFVRECDKLADLTAPLDKLVSRNLNKVVMNRHITRARMQREIDRLDGLLDGLLTQYLHVSRQIVPPEGKQGQRLLLSLMRHILTKMQNWLNDIVETLEDPLAACRKRGLPTTGHVEITLTVDIADEKLLAALRRWTDDYVAEQRRAMRMARRTASSSGGFWQSLFGVWLGVEIFEHLFGKDKD